MNDRFPVGVPCWVDLEAPDPRAAAAFYGGLFGWAFDEPASLSRSAPEQYAIARLGGDTVAGIGPGDVDAATWNTYIRVDRVELALARVVEAGGTVHSAPSVLPGAARVASCADPAGAAVRVWEPRELSGAQLVNAPGSWNFNDLHTTDLSRAKTFYGAVFGWDARTVDFGFEVATMWCVPGYGDVLDSLDPGFRQRHEDGGSPDGFVDAVGWMQELTSQTPSGGSPHWDITFAVDDVDAVTDHAVRLGGDVVVPPADAGDYVRLAVLRDPQGAVFTVNYYRG